MRITETMMGVRYCLSSNSPSGIWGLGLWFLLTFLPELTAAFLSTLCNAVALRSPHAASHDHTNWGLTLIVTVVLFWPILTLI